MDIMDLKYNKIGNMIWRLINEVHDRCMEN
jgi:hypothetical protein